MQGDIPDRHPKSRSIEILAGRPRGRARALFFVQLVLPRRARATLIRIPAPIIIGAQRGFLFDRLAMKQARFFGCEIP